MASVVNVTQYLNDVNEVFRAIVKGDEIGAGEIAKSFDVFQNGKLGKMLDNYTSGKNNYENILGNGSLEPNTKEELGA
ncbi:MAG TPA: hypothetical protein DEG71_07955 [Clostridiales bacterium]|nr:hypothetical protein [Clostridiales bacterium]